MVSRMSSYAAVLAILCVILISVSEGYQNAAGEWIECPEGYYKLNGSCYHKCDEGYDLHTDGLCYIIKPKPCPDEVTTENLSSTEVELTTAREETTTTTTKEPITSTTEETTTTTTKEPITSTTEESTTSTTKEPITSTTEVTTTTTTKEPITSTTKETTTTTTEEFTTTATEEPIATTTEEPITTTPEEPTTTITEISIASTTETYPNDPVVPPILVPDQQVRCPTGSIYFNEKCRKILCTKGEYYEGRCLLPACPDGTVWHEKKCQPPGYVTTILEIDNVIRNKFEYQTVTQNVNQVDYKTDKTHNLISEDIYKTTTPHTTTSTKTLLPENIVQDAYLGVVPPDGCCLVKSPRLCRPYPPKWVCFNRSQKLCDPRICTRSVIYLKPPRIVELDNPPMLIMPPNPPLSSCQTSECLESGFLNCTGCALGQKENCSEGCYNYFCPGDNCQFRNSEEFCALYPGGFGCNKDDGCVWKWCTEKCP